jgi:sec-independent protein translocase protein TatA
VIQVLGNLSGWHLIIVAGVVVLLFGAAKLPVFSKNLGQSIKIFRKEIHDVQDDRRAVARDEAEKAPVYTDERPAASDEPRRASGAAAPRVPGSPQR